MGRFTRFSSAGILLGLCSLGCQSLYRCDTVLHPDGSVERAVYQPVGTMGEEARRPGAWQDFAHAADPKDLPDPEGRAPVREFPTRPPGESGSYVVAAGKFASAKQVPDHVRVAAPKGSKVRDGRLVRDHTRTDYVFVVAHRWEETLTDVVRWDDMRQARGELADLLIDLWAATFDEALGKEYDDAALIRWLRTEGKAWLADVTDFAFVHCAANKGPAAQAALWAGIIDRSERHGLKLKAGGKPLEGDALGEAVRSWLVDLIRKHVVRRRDGKPVEEEVAAAWVKELLQPGKEKKDVNDLPTFGKAAERVVARKFGSPEALEQRVAGLAVRVVGLHFNLATNTFDYTLVMPGDVVETNGVLVSDRRVRWRFDAREAYPLGYDMTCRSLEPQTQLQKDLLGGEPLADRETRLEYLRLVSADEGLLAALRACRKQKALKPLYDYRRQASDAGRVDRLLKLLKLPPAGAEKAA